MAGGRRGIEHLMKTKFEVKNTRKQEEEVK